MAYNGGGSVQAVACRATRLGPTGAPVPGPKNSYVTTSLIGVDLTPNYNKQQTVSTVDGSGRVCLTFSPPQTFQYLQTDNFQICTPNPEFLEFVAGGAQITDEDTDEAIGYGVPYIGEDPVPNGVGLEFWSLNVVGGSPAGYYHWMVGVAKLIFAKNLKLNGKDGGIVELEGNGTENKNWLGGPMRDWDYEVDDRALQWVSEDVLPTWTEGYNACLPLGN